MTVKTLYDRLSERIPEELREEWDNDGLMCSSDDQKEVKRALVTLDVTEDIVDYAVSHNIDLIVSHHPLIFKPLKSVTEDSHVARKVIKLIKNDISVMSFHTRADKVEGGVNDLLADILGIKNAVPFGEGFLGRIGYNVMAEAGEMGINLIEAGHFFTEQPVTQFFQTLLHRLDPSMYIEIMDSNVIKLI